MDPAEPRVLAKHIALVGFMAAGKTTVGKRLAELLGVGFVDTDGLIEATYGAIAEIFVQHGEGEFRRREYEAVEAALAAPPCVVALGGGAVTHAPTRELLKTATTIFLAVTPRTVRERVRGAAGTRPLLGEDPRLEDISDLYASRMKWYHEADFFVDTEGRPPETVAEQIALELERRGKR
jgi:shikimate kinase